MSTQNVLPRDLTDKFRLYLVAALCALSVSLSMPETAQAQEATIQLAQQQPVQQKRRTLFDMLFGNSREQPPQQNTVRPPVQQQQQRRTTAPVKKKPVITKPKSVIVTPPPAPVVTKNADAAKILVIGDFIAGGLAEGLTETFAESTDLQIINRSNGSSGFVRQDYYNWSKELPAILAEQKPAVIVMMIGANDRQTLTQKSISLAPDTDEWKKLYQARVDEFLQVTARSGIPVIWVGQLPYQSAALSQTMLSLNTIYKQAAEQTPAKDGTEKAFFVDVWDGFVDDKGGFTQTGVDVSGQTVRLRGNDGINLTAAGKLKLAFYAEKPLRQLLKPSPAEIPASELKSNEPMAAPVQKAITRIGPMKLNDLDQSGDDVLLGDTTSAAKTSATRAENKPAPLGRADNFHWPRP